MLCNNGEGIHQDCVLTLPREDAPVYPDEMEAQARALNSCGRGGHGIVHSMAHPEVGA
jgi:hypothetical protein